MKCEICNDNKTVIVHGLIDKPVELPCNCTCNKPKSNKIPFKWEYVIEDDNGISVSTGTSRSKVNGGWLIKNVCYFRPGVISQSMTFMPDPNHEWEV